MTGDNVTPRINWAVHNHAVYSFDAAKHQESINIEPLGTGPTSVSVSGFHTIINLPVTIMPSCTPEISRRCLLALDNVDYPWNALKAKASGTITLERVIARDGTVKQVRPVAGEAERGESEAVLVNAAVQNLKTWRFESAPQQHPFRMVYSYTIDPSGSGGQTSVRFELPHRVEIQGTPPR